MSNPGLGSCPTSEKLRSLPADAGKMVGGWFGWGGECLASEDVGREFLGMMTRRPGHQ